MIVTRVGPLSLGKVFGVMYVGFGFVFGAIVSLLSLAGLAVTGGSGQGVIGAVFGVGAFLVLPIFYGILGFVGGIVGAALYNAVSGAVGGIEIHLRE